MGAYVLKECNENEKAIVVKNDKYYDADSVTMPQITFLVMSDTDAQALAFKNNEIDIALSITPTLAETYSNPGEIWNKPDVSNYFLAINSGSTGPETCLLYTSTSLSLPIKICTIRKNIGSRRPDMRC